MSTPAPATEKTTGTRLAWGVLAEFDTPEGLQLAAEAARAAGFRRLDAYTPFPMEEIQEAIGCKPTPMPFIILAGGIIGGVSIYALEYWINLYAYTLNVGGRPLHSWPSFIQPAFEGTILVSSLFGLIGLFLICGLPRLHHPLHEVEAFQRAQLDGLFLSIEFEDDSQDPQEVIRWATEQGATGAWEVPDV